MYAYHPRLRAQQIFVSAICALVLLTAGVATAEQARALPPSKLPNDSRLGPLKDLDGYFPFTPFKSPGEWNARSDRLRRQVLVSQGLWPMPTKTPHNAVIHGRVDRDDYTVEKVYLESYPGHYVTGSLYRPKGKSGKLPGVLCPHGHWPEGRFHDDGEQNVRRSIVDGAERFEIGGRHPLQARCVQLARMGCVVFHYDMIGYADSVQIPFEVAHRFANQRPELDRPEQWGFFGAQAELRLQNIMGLQTYNSIRALDWFSELPDVDPQRIAVTGASGGGTQTFILCAIDPRPAVAFPAVMVSTAMQGGCTCENATYLRVGTGNIELAALIAPRPLGMTAANDWTKEIATKGLPELQQHYAMLGAKDNVMAKSLVHFGHNYNYVSRAVMYHWLNKHLKLGHSEPIVEEDFRPLTREELSVWNEEHPRPASGPEYERSLTKWMDADARGQLAAIQPKDATSLAKYREIVGGGWDVLIGRSLPKQQDVEIEWKESIEREGLQVRAGLARYQPAKEEVPIVMIASAEKPEQIVIWLDGSGKAALFKDDGSPRQAVQDLVAGGAAVVGVDLLYQGEFLSEGKPLERTRRVANPREFVGYTLGYNHPLFSQRVHDVLTVTAALQQAYPQAKLKLAGFDGAGAIALAAKVQAADAIDAVAADTGGFQFAHVTDITDPDFLPGAVKYGDIPALAALAAPGRLWLAGDKSQLEVAEASYRTVGKPENIRNHDGNRENESAAVEWLLK